MAIEILYRIFEDNSVPPSGSKQKVFTIPDGEIWRILYLGGSSSGDRAELQLYYSDDGGSTWKNPYMEGEEDPPNFLFKLHTKYGCHVSPPKIHLEFEGDGDNVQIKIVLKNYDTVTAEMEMYFGGEIL